MKTGTAYVLFAIVATIVNLGGQWLVMMTGSLAGYSHTHALPVALVVGTGLGLVVKYVLDKIYIFGDSSTGLATHARKFSLYTLMGIVTTLIFWGTEYLFAYLDPSGRTIYLGGAIGLAIGYAIKYQLDRRVVFAAKPISSVSP